MVRVPARVFLALSFAAAPAWAPAAEVALLKSGDAPAWQPALDALRRTVGGHALSEFDLRGERSEAERVLASLKGRNAILVALGSVAAQAVRDFAPESPVVFCMISDPGKLSLLDQPSVSGVAFVIPAKNQLAAFRLVYPRATRIGVIFGESARPLVQDAQKAAGILHQTIVTREVTSEKSVPEALRSLLSGVDAVDALWIPPDPILLSDQTRRFLLWEMIKSGKPVFSSSPVLLTEGALASNGPDYVSIGEQVGELVNRLAAGDRPARGTFLMPRGELAINRRIADKLRITIPSEALKAAGRVY
jgi:putative ABC transport system substrate-binding protein